jgi:methylthioribose-1-phosphate isomerase
MEIIEAVRWAPGGNAVRIIDQRRLPAELVTLDIATVEDLCDAISTLAVRGAPAIGVAAAMGLAAVMTPYRSEPAKAFDARLRESATRIRSARPTAVNLAWAVDRALAAAAGVEDPAEVVDLLVLEADRILEEDRRMCRQIGEHGLPLLPDGTRVLTHCNAGALATAGIGTALAPIYLAAEAGRRIEVFVDETRPLMQGSRLTAWELARAGIPVTLLTDGMAASLMRAGRIDCCIVGADRIAVNGDVANKIGTYGVAVSAKHHGIPMYVAAPTSTIDSATRSGDEIEIEQRARGEVAGAIAVPDAVRVYNPAFDITPAALVTAIVTDTGIHRAPYALENMSLEGSHA